MNRHGKVSNWLTAAFGGAFGLVFLITVLGAVFNRAVYEYTVPALILLIVAAVAVLMLLYRALSKHHGFVERKFKTILVGMALLLMFVQLFVGVGLRFDPIYDLKAVFGGAEHWVQTGGFADYSADYCHDNYFYIFPNNTGTLFLMYLILSAARAVGITDNFSVMIVNCLLIIGTMCLTALICRRKFGAHIGIFAAALFLISPPFWFMAPVFYTDTLSMIFPVAVYYLILCAEDKRSVTRRLPYYVAAGLLAGIGALIKPTVLIILIAVAICFALRRQFKNLLALAAVAVLAVSLIMGGFNGYVYANHLDKATAEQMNMPTEYWLSLGLSGNGRYNNDYFSLALGERDPELRKQKLREVIAKNLDEQGVVGTLRLFATKAAYLFGDGTYALSDFLDDNPVRRGALHKFILFEGENYLAYATVATALFLAVLLFMIAAVPLGKRQVDAFVPLMCVFGLFLFLMVWEANPRYITNFIPMIFIAASAGAHRISAVIKNSKG